MLSEVVLNVSLIWSIAGITVARFGVAREKNNVASLNILRSWEVRTNGMPNWERRMNLQRVAQLLRNTPFFLTQFILAKASILTATDVVIAARYSIANSSMSKVEFHLVDTSRGILRATNSSRSSV